MAKPRYLTILPMLVGQLRSLAAAGSSIREMIEVGRSEWPAVPAATLRTLAKREFTRVGAAERLFTMDWRSKVDWQSFFGESGTIRTLKFYLKIRTADPNQGRHGWVSTMVMVPSFDKVGDIIRAIYDSAAKEFDQRGSPLGPLGTVRRDRLGNISIEALDYE